MLDHTDILNNDWLKNKPLLRIGGWLLFICFIGVITGLMVAWLKDPSAFTVWIHQGPIFDFGRYPHPWISMMNGICYATVMATSLLITIRLSHRYLPIRSWRQIAGHIIILALVSSTAFLLVAAASTGFLTDQPVLIGDPTFWTIASVALPTAFLFSAGCYFSIFINAFVRPNR